MKKLSVLIVAIVLISFAACEKETIKEESTDVELIENESNLETASKASGRNCFYYIEKGLKLGSTCYSQFHGICDIHVFCIPDIYIDPCALIPCWIDFLDPWIIYEKIRPEEFRSFRDKLELDIDPKRGAVPFALNKQVMGLQYYSQNELMTVGANPTPYPHPTPILTYTLKESATFDAETSKALGLQGNVVKAGEYPVIFNRKNKTYNVILSVEEGFRH
ncbi:hypothetical protein [Aquimarina sp. 2201CG5-10]|uniref:hypothetical protein n=1 Tax=Aquimarina callyspongiae TaxID=3098150 RepID=UPI002AB5BFAE|nr:hypothetical protein [Aquimarina sp. 2201CG5-10]MDY8137177.1 hypothetical protein [Aquimarina sp. 2201CG5-10]